MNDWGTEETATWSGAEEDDFDSISPLLTRLHSLIKNEDIKGVISLLQNSHFKVEDLEPVKVALRRLPRDAYTILSLIQLGESHNQINVQSALFEFAQLGSQQYLTLLFLANVDPNLTDEDGNSAIHFANHVETLKRFREAKADLFIRNRRGQTAVHFAALRNKGRIITYLLSFAADPLTQLNSLDHDGNSTFYYLVECLTNLMKNRDITDTPTELRIFRMMISSLGHAGISPTPDEVDRAKCQLCTRFGLDYEKTKSINCVLEQIYDEYPTEIALAFDEIVTSLICLKPGIFIEKKVIIASLSEDVDPEDDPNVPKVEKKFEHLDHTADIQIHSWGADIKEAFCHQILGMFEYMVPLERIVPKTTLTLEASAPNDKNLNELLFNFMQTALYESACDPYFMAREVKIVSFDRQALKIRFQIRGEEWNLERHGGFGTEIKAITYSAMKIMEKDDSCDIWVIVDI